MTKFRNKTRQQIALQEKEKKQKTIGKEKETTDKKNKLFQLFDLQCLMFCFVHLYFVHEKVELFGNCNIFFGHLFVFQNTNVIVLIKETN